ncbi:ATPase [Catenovulum sp. 2E275]|uniref:N-acetylglucosamine kinase n=1 Tax=Catenovulum sp. 2E275 TaxID=2980497 RepID=UPI0021D3727C|nr:BadF/BadG/BcrA/BcrD ATPase family protein [Catenovulum sp. 2E275]MCU4677353.1 ATPase [Catenovulum sp. 2E275]
MSEEIYVIGIDGGGTQCRARLYSTRRGILGAGLSGSANPTRHLDTAIHSIIEASHRAIENAGLSQLKLSDIHAGMGIAGINLAPVYKQMSKWEHPFKSCFLTTDLHIACLGAHNQPEGAVIIVGTGSSGLVVKPSENILIGGHGFPLGDYGSGAWIGFEALRYILRSLDGLADKTVMSEIILNFIGCKNALHLAETMLTAKPVDFAKLAPFVFEAAESQDLAASHIIQQGADQISALAKELLSHKPSRLSMIGGISARLRPWLDKTVSAQIQPAIYQPDYGAVVFALNQLGLSSKF